MSAHFIAITTVLHAAEDDHMERSSTVGCTCGWKPGPETPVLFHDEIVDEWTQHVMDAAELASYDDAEVGA